jgi:DNA-binding beta-propeller fold protein YncE
MKKTLFIIALATVLFGCVPETKVQRGLSPVQSREQTESDKTGLAPVEEKAASRFYPMPPEQPRLQLLISFTEDHLRTFKGGNKYFLQIGRPHDIGAVKGKIYVSDRTYKNIIVIDLDKKELSQLTSKYESTGIWVTEDDHKYVADFKYKQVIVFDNNNKLVRIYAYRDQFDKPVDVAVYEHKLYVCDLDRHKIIVLDKDSGKTIQEIGGIGTEEGLFYKPTHVIVDKEGSLYVNDFFNFRIQKFDRDGNFLKAFGYPGDTLGAFARPKGLSVDQEGHIYVVDAAFENVQIFDDETTDLLFFFGGYGLTPGSMYLPNGIYIDYENTEYFKEYVDDNFELKYLVYVGNTLGPIKLNVYGFGEWIGPPLEEAGEIDEK